MESFDRLWEHEIYDLLFYYNECYDLPDFICSKKNDPFSILPEIWGHDKLNVIKKSWVRFKNNLISKKDMVELLRWQFWTQKDTPFLYIIFLLFGKYARRDKRTFRELEVFIKRRGLKTDPLLISVCLYVLENKFGDKKASDIKKLKVKINATLISNYCHI